MSLLLPALFVLGLPHQPCRKQALQCVLLGPEIPDYRSKGWGGTVVLHCQVEKVQSELDGLAATLKQVELYNEQMKGEIAVTRR